MNRRGFIGRLTALIASVLTWRRAEPAAHWLEDGPAETTDVVVSHAHWSQNEIRVAHPSRFAMGDIVHVPRTSENFLVTNVGLLSLYVRRGIGSDAANIPEGDPVWILGGASETSYEAEAAQQAEYETWKAQASAK